MINRRDPYWQHGSLKARSEIELLSIFLVSSPEQEPNVIPVDNTKLSVPKLYKSNNQDIFSNGFLDSHYVKVGSFKIIWRNNSIVKEGSCYPSQDQV